MMGYRLLYNITTRQQTIARLLMLSIGVVLDGVSIYLIVQSILTLPSLAYYLFLSVISSIVIRYIAIKMQRNVEYQLYNDSIKITLKYPLSQKILIDCKICDIQQVCAIQDYANVNGVDISTKFDKIYLLKYNDICYICNLDDYMYAKLLEGQGK